MANERTRTLGIWGVIVEADMSKLVSRFARDESGATAIEYGLIAALISVVIITALKAVGNNLTVDFNSVASSLR